MNGHLTFVVGKFTFLGKIVSSTSLDCAGYISTEKKVWSQNGLAFLPIQITFVVKRGQGMAGRLRKEVKS